MKISPGRGGELWDDWRSEGYAAIGFSDLGYLAGNSRQEFDLRQKDASVRNPDWGKAGPVQAWTLREIPEGSFLIANRGTSEILGVGKVVGRYYFVPDSELGDRLPVKWFATTVRSVDQPGWRRTLMGLDKEEFEELVGTDLSL